MIFVAHTTDADAAPAWHIVEADERKNVWRVIARFLPAEIVVNVETLEEFQRRVVRNDADLEGVRLALRSAWTPESAAGLLASSHRHMVLRRRRRA